jgi:hypothetical protein
MLALQLVLTNVGNKFCFVILSMKKEWGAWGVGNASARLAIGLGLSFVLPLLSLSWSVFCLASRLCLVFFSETAKRERKKKERKRQKTDLSFSTSFSQRSAASFNASICFLLFLSLSFFTSLGLESWVFGLFLFLFHLSLRLFL